MMHCMNILIRLLVLPLRMPDVIPQLGLKQMIEQWIAKSYCDFRGA